MRRKTDVRSSERDERLPVDDVADATATPAVRSSIAVAVAARNLLAIRITPLVLGRGRRRPSASAPDCYEHPAGRDHGKERGAACHHAGVGSAAVLGAPRPLGADRGRGPQLVLAERR
jgi:hypothetical protein